MCIRDSMLTALKLIFSGRSRDVLVCVSVRRMPGLIVVAVYSGRFTVRHNIVVCFVMIQSPAVSTIVIMVCVQRKFGAVVIVRVILV